MQSESSQSTRTPRYSRPTIKTYTREGVEEDQERVKIVRSKTIRTGTLTGTETVEATMQETLADMPAGNAYNVMQALAEHFNCEVTER